MPQIEAYSDAPPVSDHVTVYDRDHHVLYMRLLDADDEAADPAEVAMVLFGLDAAREPERARRVVAAHLARARWMTEHGYRDVLLHGMPS